MSQPPLRVLHVSESAQGGVATYLNSLFTQQSQDPRIAAVHLVASRQHRRFLGSIPDACITCYDYPKRSLRGLLALRRTMLQSIREFQPDVIHLSSTFPGVIGRIPWSIETGPAGQRPAIVYCAHGWSFLMDVRNFKRKTYRSIERILSRRADRIICISDHEYQAAIDAGIPSSTCVRVHNALPSEIPEAQFVQLPPAVADLQRNGKTIFLFVGRYDHQKGLDLLLSAFRNHGIPAGILLAVGDSVVQGSSIQFDPPTYNLGWATPGQVTQLLELCDALVVPSRWEGFGLVAAEAMRAGKAVICSNRGGLPEVVEDQVTGVLLNSLDPAGIAAALNSLDRETLAIMGQAGLKRFHQKFTSERMHAETLEVYQQALIARRTA